MSAIAAALKHMLAAGMDHAAICAAVADMEAASPAKAGKSARNARAYQKRKALKATESAAESDLIHNPIKATEATENDLIQPPLTRVVDKSLTTEIYPNTLSLSQVREAAGDALASMATHAGLATLAPLLGLLTAEPPCEQSEVLDGIAKAAAWYRANRPPGSMTNWKLARTMALELRDARIAGIPKPKAPHEQPSPNRQNGFTDPQRSRADANFAGAALALDRRRQARGAEPPGPDGGGPPSLTLISGGGA